ncbi:hypothetical protein GCM10009681_09900 [Luedemannella helvata]|uniref:AB hydrolase-1 domain-containing protein n=1 Tax=Luedemannella helvata TaxID=349315 RepID=A0ABP4W088_9ACTN
MRSATGIVALVALVLAGAGCWLLAGAAPELGRRHVVVGGLPVDEVHPAGGGRHPGVVVAHGFAGSAKLMAPFGDTLAARGYVVVLLDFSGHGTNTRPLPDGDRSADALARDLDVATAHLRGLPDVDPTRIALVGHSMGAGAVTRYAAGHPDIGATVAISLPDASEVAPERPRRLLLLVGGLEFAGFRTAVAHAVDGAGPGRASLTVPGVEHITILYAPRAHRETVTWLDDSLGGPAGGGSPPAPTRRAAGAGLLLTALLIGIYPVARLALGVHRPWPTLTVPVIGRCAAVAAGAAVVALPLAALAPAARVPLAVGGFVAGFAAASGAALLGYARVRRAGPDEGSGGAGAGRVAVVAPVLVAYAALTIAVPLHTGLTSAVPVGPRWWLLACVWAALALLAFGADRVADGNAFGVLVVSAVAVFALTVAAAVGLAPGFLLLIVPLLAILLLCQAAWGAVLHRSGAPAWLVALVGSLLVAWPLATALPLVG